MVIRSLCAKPAPKNKLSAIMVEEFQTRNRQLSRGLGRIFAIGCLGLAVVSTGCTMSSGVCRSVGQSDCINDFMIGYRNKAMAEKAWHCNKHRFCDKQHAGAFKDGFIQGYAEVASGGNGCVPAVAPSEYWGWRYQSAQGQCAVNAWFEGFPMGVQAAEEDGIGHWQTIRPSGYVPPGAAVAPAVAPAFQTNDEAIGNPFQPDQPYVPAPIPTDDEDVMDLDIDIDGLNGDPVFDSASNDFPVIGDFADESPDLVSQSDTIHQEAAVATTLTGDSDEISGVAIDDIFGSAAGSAGDSGTSSADTEELPFSFE